MVASASGLIAVAFGAFAAHSPIPGLPPEGRDWIATGLRYQMFHTAALLAVALLAARRPARPLTLAGWGFALGSLLFSGSLYVMALGGPRGLGLVVPIGGLALIAGWVGLFFHAWQEGRGNER
jgi:uncharacterized membrane protein YgdD (TMEM256/DUF423 family)